MPVDQSGNSTRPSSPIPVTGQNADAPQVNSPIDDIYAILNMLAFRDGRAPLRGNISMNSYRATGAADGTDPQDYVTKAQLDAVAAANSIFPGFQMADTVTSGGAPAGWVYANGQSLSRVTFAALWARVQSGNNLAATQAAKTHGQYGPGDGSTTFTIPNLYADDGYFIRPMASGRTIGSVQPDDLKGHTHTGTTNNDGSHTHQYEDNRVVSSGGGFGGGQQWGFPTDITRTTGGAAHQHAFTTNATGGTETRPKNIAYPVLIKT